MATILGNSQDSEVCMEVEEKVPKNDESLRPPMILYGSEPQVQLKTTPPPTYEDFRFVHLQSRLERSNAFTVEGLLISISFPVQLYLFSPD